MKNKVWIVLSVIFTFQFIVSCCNCDPVQTFENQYDDVTVVAYDTSGFSVEEVNGEVYKNAFGLGVMVNFETIKVSSAINMFAPMGFGTALAFSCDCIGDEFLYPDPLTKLVIYSIDPVSLEKIDVTENFKMPSYDDQLISVDEFFKQRAVWHDGFQLTLVNYENLDDEVIFEAEVFLESGKSFKKQTAIIKFINN